jgi:hypothetical protein
MTLLFQKTNQRGEYNAVFDVATYTMRNIVTTSGRLDLS